MLPVVRSTESLAEVIDNRSKQLSELRQLNDNGLLTEEYINEREATCIMETFKKLLHNMYPHLDMCP